MARALVPALTTTAARHLYAARESRLKRPASSMKGEANAVSQDSDCHRRCRGMRRDAARCECRAHHFMDHAGEQRRPERHRKRQRLRRQG